MKIVIHGYAAEICINIELCPKTHKGLVWLLLWIWKTFSLSWNIFNSWMFVLCWNNFSSPSIGIFSSFNETKTAQVFVRGPERPHHVNLSFGFRFIIDFIRIEYYWLTDTVLSCYAIKGKCSPQCYHTETLSVFFPLVPFHPDPEKRNKLQEILILLPLTFHFAVNRFYLFPRPPFSPHLKYLIGSIKLIYFFFFDAI